VKENNGETLQVSSSLSNSIIVITNESQWAEAAGKLFLQEIFGLAENTKDTYDKASWPLLANIIHRFLFQVTEQNLEGPCRGLSETEVQYIHTKYFADRENVTRHQASNFWGWFGHVLSALRFKRHVKNLWCSGLIYGFVTKEDCSKLLKEEEAGVFVIRFSDSVPGSFAVAYVTDEQDVNDRVKHYLIKSEDIGSNKSLPDFLREKQQFKVLTYLQPRTGKYVLENKESAMQDLYSRRSKKEDLTDTRGYVNTDTS